MINVPSLIELNTESTSRLRDYTNLTNVHDGSPAYGIVRAINELAYRMFLELRSGELSNSISQARGSDLDSFGEILGLTRSNATFASDLSYRNFRFYLNSAVDSPASFNQLVTRINSHFPASEQLPNPGASLIIPAGTELFSSNSPGVGYTTMDAATISANSTTSYVRVSSQVVGTEGNIGQNALDTWSTTDPYLQYAKGIILCGNLQDISTGTTILSDQEYKFRLINQITGSVTSNMTAVRLAALSVPGVSDVIIKPWTHGIGTLSIFPIVSATMVQQGIINAVQISVDSVKAAGNRIYVMEPIYIGIKATIQINFKLDVPALDRQSVINTIRNQTVDYINNIQIGGEMIMTDLIAIGKNASPSVRDIMIVLLQGGELDTTTLVIPNLETLIIFNQILRYNEKFYTNGSFITICEV